MKFIQNISLKAFNTFGIDVSARQFITCTSIQELSEILFINKGNPLLILGGGSNMLFTKDFNGTVIKNEIKGISIVKEDDQHIYIKAGGGEVWQDFVTYCVDHNYGGIENLSLIPGTVGASPIQNIGAYGVEIKDTFHELTAYHIEDNKLLTFNKEECKFGYRDSIFKNEYKNKLFIVDVTFRLDKHPIFKTSYGDIEAKIKEQHIEVLNVKAISDIICDIRKSKLPDPAVVGNAGSFFKNPVVDKAVSNAILANYPTAPHFKVDDLHDKIPAAWLIEQCGWKGKSDGEVGCHAKQPLVLINLGKADGQSIYNLSQKIMDSVKKKFGVALEREVNIL